jgi:hypothetical protein
MEGEYTITASNPNTSLEDYYEVFGILVLKGYLPKLFWALSMCDSSTESTYIFIPIVIIETFPNP